MYTNIICSMQFRKQLIEKSKRNCQIITDTLFDSTQTKPSVATSFVLYHRISKTTVNLDVRAAVQSSSGSIWYYPNPVYLRGR